MNRKEIEDRIELYREMLKGCMPNHSDLILEGIARCEEQLDITYPE